MLFRSGDGGDVVGGDGDHAGSAPPEFSPSNLQLQISVLVFLCFRWPPSEKQRETIFIVVFRSRRSFWKKDRRQRSHEGPDEWSHAAKESGHVGHLFRPSGLHFFASFAPMHSSFQKMILVNFQVNWTSFGSLKHQNIENRVFCQCRVNSRKIGKL